MKDHILEAELEAFFRGECKALGLVTMKLNLQQNRGYPDRVVLHKGAAHFAELKTLTGKQTPLQKYRASQLNRAGFDVVVLRTKAEIREYLRGIANAT
jgi:hypothetical protein